MRVRRSGSAVLGLVLTAAALLAEPGAPAPAGDPPAIHTYQVSQSRLMGGRSGDLLFFEHKLLFRAADPTNSREWAWADLRYLVWKGPGELEVHTSERGITSMGRQRKVTFRVVRPHLDERAVTWANGRIHAAQTGVETPPPTGPTPVWPKLYPVEHRHAFGGCTGDLVITAEAIHFRPYTGDHEFRLSYMDIRSLSRRHPAHLELVTYRRRALQLWSAQRIALDILGTEIPDDVYDWMVREVDRHRRPED